MAVEVIEAAADQDHVRGHADGDGGDEASFARKPLSQLLWVARCGIDQVMCGDCMLMVLSYLGFEALLGAGDKGKVGGNSAGEDDGGGDADGPPFCGDAGMGGLRAWIGGGFVDQRIDL